MRIKFLGLSKNALGMLISKYRAVLQKMLLKNSAAILASGLFLVTTPALAAEYTVGGPNSQYTSLAQLQQAGITFEDNDTIIVFGNDDSLTAPLDFGGKNVVIKKVSGNNASSYASAFTKIAPQPSAAYFSNTVRPIELNNANLTVEHSDLSGYDQTGTNSFGGVAHLNNSSTLTLRDVSVDNNKAALGGAAYLNNNSKINFTDGTLTNSTAGMGGSMYLNNHSILNLSQVAVNNNHADEAGGAFYLHNNGRIEFKDGDLTYNTTRGDGGAVYLSNNSIMTFKWAEFRGNKANNSGGAAYIDGGSVLTVAEGSLNNNSAAKNGGAIYLNDSAATIDLAGLGGNTAGESGGAAYLDKSLLTAESAGFNNNSASNGGALYLNDSSMLKFKYGGFDANSATNGGAVYLKNSGMDTNGVSFTNNKSQRNGGAVVVESGTFAATNANFVNNTAAESGGAVYVNGTSTLTLNTTTGQSTLFSGNKAGSSSNSIYFNGVNGGASALNITGAGLLDMQDAINSSAGSYNISVSKNGTGIWKLAGDNKFRANGTTSFVVNSGTLDLYKGAKISIDKGNFSLGSGTVLICSSDNEISAENINFAKDSTLDFDLTGRAANSHYILRLNGSTGSSNAIGSQNIDIIGDLEINRTTSPKIYNLISGASGIKFTNTGALTYNGETAADSRRITAFSLVNTTPNSLELQVAPLQNTNSDLVWTGVKNGIWDELGEKNWNGMVNSQVVKQFLNGDAVSFLDSGANKDITVQSAGVEVGAMKVNNSTGSNYSFNGGAITNKGDLLKQGGGMLTIGNMQARNVYLENGELVVSDGKTLTVTGGLKTETGTYLTVGADKNKAAITADSVTLGANSIINVDGYSGDQYGQKAITLIESKQKISASTFKYTIGHESSVDYLNATVTAQDYKVVADIGLTWYSQNLQSGAHGTFTLDNTIDHFTVGTVLENRNNLANAANNWNGKTLTKAGLGTLTLTGANTYDGGTNLTGGRLEVGHDAALGKGSLNMSNGTELVFVGNHSITNAIGITGEGSIDTKSYTTEISGAITGGGLAKTGQGALILSGNNIYGGDTKLNEGRINIGSNSALGNGSGDLIMAGGTTLGFAGDNYSVSNDIKLKGTNAIFDTGSFNAAIGGQISEENGANPSSLTKTGGGTLTLNKANTYTAGTSIEQGKVIAENSSALGGGKVEIKNSATLALAFDGNFANELLGEGNLITNGGIVINRANNYFNGNSIIESGTTTLKTDGALGDGGIKIKEGASLNITFGVEFDNELSGGGKLIKSGADTLKIAGDNSFYYGDISLESGRLNIGHANALGKGGTLEMSGGTTLGFNAAYSIGNDILLNGAAKIDGGQYNNKLSGSINGSGSLNKTGGGTLTLSGANDYSGGTSINEGKITALSPTALGKGKVQNNTSLELNFNGEFENVLAGAGDISTRGNISITSSNSGFSGKTTVNQGTTTLKKSDSLGSGEVAVNNNTALSLNFNGEFANNLIGNGDLKIGGNVAINRANSNFQGDVTIFQGMATLGNISALNKSDIKIQKGAAISLNLGGKFDNTLSGEGHLEKSGSGSLILGGNNSHSGGTNIKAGSIEIDNANSLGTGLLTMENGTTLGFAKNYSLGNDILIKGKATIKSDKFNETLTGDITGVGTLYKTGGGLLTLEGNNSYSGGTVITEGKLIVNSAESLGRGSVTNDAELKFDLSERNSGSFTYNIGGAGDLIKDGLGKLTLSGANNYLGNTIVNAGSLTGNIAYGTKLTVNSGAAYNAGSYGRTLTSLDGRGTVNMQNKDLTIESGDFGDGELTAAGLLTKISANTFIVGNSDVAKVNLEKGELTVYGGKALNVNDQLNVKKDAILSVSADPNKVAITAGGVNLESDSIINIDGYCGGDIVTLIESDSNINNAGFKYTIGGHAQGIDYLRATVNIEGNNKIVADIGLTWYSQLTTTPAHGTFTLTDKKDHFTVGAVLDDLTNLGNAKPGWYGDRLTKAGAGTLTLTGANTYTGGTNLEGGRLEIGYDTALGKGSLDMAAGTELGFVGNHSITNAIKITGEATIDTKTYNAEIGGAITGVAITGGLTKSGKGTLTLSGNNTYTGDTKLNEGRINIGSNSALGDGSGKLIMADETTLGFVGGGLFVDTDIKLTGKDAIFDTGSFNAAVSGQISEEYSANPSHLTKTGGGTLTLSNVNTYTGGTFIKEGTLAAENISALGDGGVDVADNAVLKFANGANGNFSQEITGKGSLDVSGGNILLSGNNTYTGGTSISGANTLSVNNAAALGSGNIIIRDADSVLKFDLTDNNSKPFTFSNEISGLGTLTKSGTGILTLTGNNSHTSTSLEEGRINVGSATALGNGTLAMADNTVLGFTNNYSIGNGIDLKNGGAFVDTGIFNNTLSGQITGSGTLIKSGGGTLTLTGNNSYGNTNLEEGHINIGSNTALGAGTLTMADGTALGFLNNYSVGNDIDLKNGGAFVDTGIFNNTLNGQITGGGTLNKIGSGTLTLTGINNYLGGTVIENGTVIIKNEKSLGGTGYVDITNNGMLNFFIDTPLRIAKTAGSEIYIDSYSGSGIMGIQAAATLSDHWSDVLKFTETPDSANIHFYFSPDSSIDYIRSEGLKFATLAGTGANDTFLIDGHQSIQAGANELRVIPNDAMNEYYLKSSYNSSIGELYSEISTVGIWEAANMHDLTLFDGIRQAGRDAGGNSPGVYAGVEKIDSSHKMSDSADSDISGNRFLAALAWKNKETTYGVFGQKFNGKYHADHTSVLYGGANNLARSSGELRHHDFGLFLEHQPDDTGHYYTAVVRAGRSGSDFSSSSGQGLSSTFQTNKNLFGFSLGGGYRKSTGENTSTKYYTHLIYTSLGGDDITDSLGQKISFKSSDSLRLLSGVQLNLNQNKKTHAFLGAALDYEFKGATEALFASGNTAASSNLKGLTGILELGFSSKQSESLTIEGTVRSFIGKKEGFGGTLTVSKRF